MLLRYRPETTVRGAYGSVDVAGVHAVSETASGKLAIARRAVAQGADLRC
ncbi:hypothetical protein ACWCPQ_28720 [Nocardia sp. NPDC001965]